MGGNVGIHGTGDTVGEFAEFQRLGEDGDIAGFFGLFCTKFRHLAVTHKKWWREGKDDPIRAGNQCQHGRDGHAPLAFASHTLFFQLRISEGGGFWPTIGTPYKAGFIRTD